MDKLICIETFITTIKCGSLRKAAAELYQTEASVSKRITRLESDLGIKLIERERKGLKLTAIGEQYFQLCQEGIASLAAAAKYVTSQQREPSGKLKVVCNDFYAKRYIMPKLDSFLKKYPCIQLSLEVLELFPDFSKYQMDVLFGVGLPLPDNLDLVQKRLGVTQEVICATPKYLKSHYIKKPNDLVQLDYIAHSHRRPSHKIILDNDIEIATTPRLYCNNAQTSIEAALKHIGFIYIKKYLVESYLESCRLIQILPKFTKSEIPIYAYYRSQPYPDVKVRAFLEFF